MGTDATYHRALSDFVTYRLARINAQLGAQAVRILRETAGLSLIQWRVLSVLDDSGRASPSEIARITGIDKGQLSRTLKGMVRQQLVSSETSQTDHRSHVLSLSGKGRTLFEATRPVMYQRQARLSGCLSDAERDQLFALLDRISTAAAELDSEGDLPSG